MSLIQGYSLKLECFGPLHVGSGETVPAYEYLAPDVTPPYVLIFDSGRLLELLTPRQKGLYIDAVARSPGEAQRVLRQFYVRENVQLDSALLRKVFTSKAADELLKGANEASEMPIRLFMNTLHGAYVPGSSVKGALRTAWIYHKILEKGQDIKLEDTRGWGMDWVLGEHSTEPKIASFSQTDTPASTKLQMAFEKKVLGHKDPKDDPFRAVRIADSGCITPDKLLINRIWIYHPKPSRTAELGEVPIVAETVRVGTSIELNIRFDTGLWQGRRLRVSHAIEPSALVEACRKYYSKVLESEEKFAQENKLENVLQTLTKLRNRVEEDAKLFPLRMGFGMGKLATTMALLMDQTSEEGEHPHTKKTAGYSEPIKGVPLGWMIGQLVQDGA